MVHYLFKRQISKFSSVANATQAASGIRQSAAAASSRRKRSIAARITSHCNTMFKRPGEGAVQPKKQPWPGRVQSELHKEQDQRRAPRSAMWFSKNPPHSVGHQTVECGPHRCEQPARRIEGRFCQPRVPRGKVRISGPPAKKRRTDDGEDCDCRFLPE